MGASGAGDGPGSRQQGVEEQHPAKLGLFRRAGIISRKGDGGRPGEFRHPRRAVTVSGKRRGNASRNEQGDGNQGEPPARLAGFVTNFNMFPQPGNPRILRPIGAWSQ
jgi:hypothetical protein